MKKDFTQWKDEYGLEFEPNYSKETELDCKAAFKAGQQSRQAEIDELKMTNHNLSVMVAEAESYSEYFKYERDKLQKKIDLVLDYIEPSDEISHKAYRELYKILKRRRN